MYCDFSHKSCEFNHINEGGEGEKDHVGKNININEVKTIISRTTCYLGVGAIARVDGICKALADKGVKNVLVVSGRGSYKATGAWNHVVKAFAAHKINYVLYDKVTPNPTVDGIDEAIALGKGIGATAVFGIGGGSRPRARQSCWNTPTKTPATCTSTASCPTRPNRSWPST